MRPCDQVTKDESGCREPGQVKGFRPVWELGEFDVSPGGVGSRVQGSISTMAAGGGISGAKLCGARVVGRRHPIPDNLAPLLGFQSPEPLQKSLDLLRSGSVEPVHRGRANGANRAIGC